MNHIKINVYIALFL